jgi:hypothetical protein
MKIKTARNWKVSFSIIFLSFLSVSAFAATQKVEDQPIRLEGKLQVPIPSELKALHITNPYAKILIEVDEKGSILDSMPIEASHTGLLIPALEAVQKAGFNPAVVKGSPSRSQAAVYVNFFDVEQRIWRSGSGVVPFGDSASDAAQRRFYQVAPGRFVYRLSKPKDLDTPLKMKEGKLKIYSSEEGVRPKGSCLVEFYVGPEGKVHFPRIIRSDNEDVSMSALLTMKETSFESPLRDGKSTCIRVQQPFNFN